MQRIGFVGLGNMGSPMVVNLIHAGCSVKAYDLDASALAVASSEGAAVAQSLAHLAEDVDVIVTMLPASEHVSQVYLGHDEEAGLLSLIKAGTFLIDCSTIDPEMARKVASEATSKGFEFVDAPVSGGVAGAQAGTLTFIVGGTEQAFQRSQTVLNHMGNKILHAGGAGDGQMAKICNNLMLGILMTGACEALNLGIDNGLDPKVLSEIMLQSSGKNWALELYNPCPGIMDNVPASHDYRPGFMTKLMLKDLGLGLDAAAKSQSSIPLGSLVRNLYSYHNTNGNGELDFSSLFKFYQKLSKQ